MGPSANEIAKRWRALGHGQARRLFGSLVPGNRVGPPLFARPGEPRLLGVAEPLDVGLARCVLAGKLSPQRLGRATGHAHVYRPPVHAPPLARTPRARRLREVT